MELKINNKTMDLSADAKASVDYEVFSADASNLVSTVSSLDLPSTDKNLSEITIGTKQEATLTSQYGTPFVGTVGIDKQTFNSIDDSISITLYDYIKSAFDKMEEDLIDITGQETIATWSFADNASKIPNVANGYTWFFTTADFNGFSRKGDSFDSMTIYPAKTISHKNQLLLTIRLDVFLDKVFDYYQVDHYFGQDDDVFKGTKFNELYLFVPVKKYVVTNDKMMVRQTIRQFGGSTWGTFSSEASNYYGNSTCDVQVFDTIYGVEQDKIMTDAAGQIAREITGTTDTKYRLELNNTITLETDYKACRPYIESNNEQGTVDLVLEALVDGQVVGTAVLEEDLQWVQSRAYSQPFPLPDGYTTENQKTHVIDLDLIDWDVEFELYTASSFSLRPNFRFNYYLVNDVKNYNVVPSPNDNITTLVDTYGANEIVNALTQTRPQVSTILDSNSPIFNLVPIEALAPLRREYQTPVQKYNYTHTDEIDMDATLKATELTVKDALSQIVNRYNLGFWVTSNGTLKLSNWNDRYDHTEIVSLYESSGEPYEKDYTDNLVHSFSYKNEYDGIKSTEIEDEQYNEGDVYKQEFSEDGKSLNISLKGSPSTPLVYGDKVEPQSYSVLDIVPDFRLWGFSENEQLDPDSIPVMTGYISDNKYNITPRLSRVMAFDAGDDGVSDFSPYTHYTINGYKYATDRSNSTTNQEIISEYKMHVPQLTKANGSGGIQLGVDGVVDESLNLYNNFKYMLDPTDHTITVEGLLSHSEKSSILNGAMVRIFGLDASNAIFKVLSIEGFMFDQEKSVVKLRLKKYVSYV